MNTALVISLGAVMMSLFVVFVALRNANAKPKSKSGNDGAASTTSDGSSDCSTSDGGSCDGGGGD